MDVEKNPLGLGPRHPPDPGTGTTEDTSYDARGDDPYTTGEPDRNFGGLGEFENDRNLPPTPVDPDAPPPDPLAPEGV